MAEQAPLFPGNRGCGKRERSAADVAETRDRVIVRIDGLETTTPNTTRFRTPGGARAHHRRNKVVRETVWARVLAAVGNRVRSRGVASIRVTRFSRGQLDDDNLIAAVKSARDGIAKAIGIDDRWFSVTSAPGKIPFICEQSPGKPGLAIEVVFARPEGNEGE